jgi:hypothetical protein
MAGVPEGDWYCPDCSNKKIVNEKIIRVYASGTVYFQTPDLSSMGLAEPYTEVKSREDDEISRFIQRLSERWQLRSKTNTENDHFEEISQILSEHPFVTSEEVSNIL